MSGIEEGGRIVEGYERRLWNEVYESGKWKGLCNTWPAVAVLEDKNKTRKLIRALMFFD